MSFSSLLFPFFGMFLHHFMFAHCVFHVGAQCAWARCTVGRLVLLESEEDSG